MSFSLKVKEELASVLPPARHCRLAELAAIISAGGHIYTTDDGRHYIRFHSETPYAVSKCQHIIYKTFEYEPDVSVRYNKDTGNRTYIMSVMDSDMAIKILLATRLMEPDGSINRDMSLVSTVGISNMCCKRAFLRGAFLAGGSISDPEKSYHFEIVSYGEAKAVQIMDAMKMFELDARMIIFNRGIYL